MGNQDNKANTDRLNEKELRVKENERLTEAAKENDRENRRKTEQKSKPQEAMEALAQTSSYAAIAQKQTALTQLC